MGSDILKTSMTYAEVRDTIASWSIEGKRLLLVEFIDAQQKEIERLRQENAELRKAKEILESL